MSGRKPGRQRAVVPVHYDFASTLCYVAHVVMGRMQPRLDELGIVLDWTPVDLVELLPGPWTRGGAIPEDRRRHTAAVAAALGVPVHPPRTWLDSRPAHAVALALRARPEREATWRERIWTAWYEGSHSGGRPAAADAAHEVADLVASLGWTLEPSALVDRARELRSRTRAAAEAEVTGLPTFMLGDWPFGGIQEEPTMQAVLARYVERLGGASSSTA